MRAHSETARQKLFCDVAGTVLYVLYAHLEMLLHLHITLLALHIFTWPLLVNRDKQPEDKQSIVFDQLDDLLSQPQLNHNTTSTQTQW